MGDPAGGVMGFDEALEIVLRQAADLAPPEQEEAVLLACNGRILARSVAADRHQPPFHRSTRDGFAIRAVDAGDELTVVGQIRAGEQWRGLPLQQGESIEIMTGAPLPQGADAVVMIEHVELSDKKIRLLQGKKILAGENIVPKGSEARVGDVVLASGTLIEAAEIALAASCGVSRLNVYRRPAVAIVSTGDELVEIDAVPDTQQIRNSNSYGLSALVTSTGGEPVRLPIAPDKRLELEQTILRARGSDLMLLSGGVSMGKYDLVEEVLHEFGAEFFFTGVRMQPGKPVVFGRLPATDKLPAQFFFGLPGNPISVQVTFHCFVALMLRAMCGSGAQSPRFVQATLSEDVAGKAGLMRFLPARLTSDRKVPQICVVGWQGSGDLAANARANCYAVLPPEKEKFVAGEVITVLLR